MSKSIKNRIFGSNIPDHIKAKMEVRQALAKSAEPMEAIDEIRSKYPEIQDSYYTYDNMSPNFGGLADLSSRTPFARMWTSVDLAIDETLSEDMDENELKQWRKLKELDPDAWKNQFIKKTSNDKSELHEVTPIEKSQRIYEIGNHVLNTLQRDPGAPISETLSGKSIGGDVTEVEADIVRAAIPYEQESDSNQFLKPPAGINSISSATEGALGAIKKTTVNFQVHNFSDFENIYLRYFLRPGAQVFIDFGWDTAFLYDIDKLLNSEDIEETLYGENGYVTNSHGDMETLYGHVTGYNASVREDGGFDCMVEIVSKNAALVSSQYNEKLKDRIAYGLDIEAMGYAVSGVLGNHMYYRRAQKWGNDSTTEEELRITLQIAASTLLGGTSVTLPGINLADESSAQAMSQLALEHGVFFAGNQESNMKLFVNLGWFEDKFLNKEFGFSDTKSGLINENKAKKAEDEGSLKAKFNSRNSFMTFNEGFRGAQMMGGYYQGANFLYPGSWGSNGPTYNILRRMIPDRLDANGELIDMSKSFNEIPIEDWVSWEEKDIKRNRVPIREIFISVDMIKTAMSTSNSISEFLKNMMDRINKESRGLIDLQIKSNSYGQHSLGFVDKNYVDAEESTRANENPTFMDELLTFKPYTANTIVKEYNLEFSMPEGGLGDMLAIQASKHNGPEQSISNTIDGFIKMKQMDKHQNTMIKYKPSIGDYAGDRFEERTDNIGNTFGFNSNEVLFNMKDDATISRRQKNLKLLDFEGVGSLSDNFDLETFQKVLTLNLNRAVGPDDLEGNTIFPDPPKEEKTEDTKNAEEELAKDGGYKLSDDPFRYWLDTVVTDAIYKTSPLLEIKASLKIYGVSSLVPGDLIRINYLPKNYREKAYFQITKVSQNLEASWDTSIEAKMRVIGTPEAVKGKDYKLRKSYLRTGLTLNKIDEIIHVMDNIKPIIVPPEYGTMIDNIFECELIGTENESDLVVFGMKLPSYMNEDVVKHHIGMSTESIVKKLEKAGVIIPNPLASGQTMKERGLEYLKFVKGVGIAAQTANPVGMIVGGNKITKGLMYTPEGQFAAAEGQTGNTWGEGNETVKVKITYIPFAQSAMNIFNKITFGALPGYEKTCSIKIKPVDGSWKKGKKFMLYTAGKRWGIGPYPMTMDYMNGMAGVLAVTQPEREVQLQENEENWIDQMKTIQRNRIVKNSGQKAHEAKIAEHGFTWFDWDTSKTQFQTYEKAMDCFNNLGGGKCNDCPSDWEFDNIWGKCISPVTMNKPPGMSVEAYTQQVKTYTDDW